MKIILDNENNEEVFKEAEQQVKEKYIVAKNSHIAGKQVGTLFLGIIGGVIGGVLSTMVVMDIASGDKLSSGKGENTVTNSTVTSYNFATVENPVVAISKQVGPSVVGINVSYKAQTFFRND